MLQVSHGLGNCLDNLQRYLLLTLLPLSTGIALFPSFSTPAEAQVVIRIRSSSSPDLEFYDSGSRYPYSIQGSDIEDSVLVNPVLIDSDVEDSRLVNPVLINSDVDDSEIWITRPQSTGRYRSNCLVMAELRAACQ